MSKKSAAIEELRAAIKQKLVEPEAQEDKEAVIRRTYFIQISMLERILTVQLKERDRSEIATVRRLLAIGLDAYEAKKRRAG